MPKITAQEYFSFNTLTAPSRHTGQPHRKVFLGKIEYRDGEPVSSGPVEMTSQGPQVNGLDAREWISAGYACHLHGGREQAYIAPVYEQRDDVSAPVTNITDGTVAGFRYLQFGKNPPKTVTAVAKAETGITVSVRLDKADGREIACLRLDQGQTENTAPLKDDVTGKHAVYFVFRTGNAKAEFNRFTFDG